MLNKNEKGFLLFKKKDYLSQVLDYFLTEQEKQEQTIFKIINELHTKKVITAETQKLLQFAVINYQFKIIETLAQCEELHIRLYDSNEKGYTKKHNAFYKNIENSEQPKIEKFKNFEMLQKSYLELEKEHTKKCQQIKELKNEKTN